MLFSRLITSTKYLQILEDHKNDDGLENQPTTVAKKTIQNVVPQSKESVPITNALKLEVQDTKASECQSDNLESLKSIEIDQKPSAFKLEVQTDDLQSKATNDVTKIKIGLTEHPESSSCQCQQTNGSAESVLIPILQKSVNSVSEVPSDADKTVIETRTSETKQSNNSESNTPMVRGSISITFRELPVSHSHVTITQVIDARTIFIRPIDLVSNKEYSANVEAIDQYAVIAKNLQETPLVGQMILAKNNEQFHRAVVIKVVGDRFAVAFIEYGHISLVPLADCKELAGDLQVLKRYIHKCKLDISPEVNDKHEDAIKLLNEMLNVDMEIIYNSPFNNGTLVNLLQLSNGQSLRDQINSFVE